MIVVNILIFLLFQVTMENIINVKK